MPEQEVAQTEFPAGADHEIGIRNVGQIEMTGEELFVNFDGVEFSGFHLFGDLPRGVGDLGASAVIQRKNQSVFPELGSLRNGVTEI